ncbi:MAG: division/cell wall cluster transcriptional repressor MraZ [Candidatus Latescibacteria bacterium]|nr:division/cell wall cluster transcriptional repressor MraZ [Candidatus Latescibacterota bacterium]MDP7449105.1 division/cell wall cluster transcriptional repressor MraZ [Candidatus Latescibacterota bacterium]HJP29044.1 division/cell wall cluster transcriptional repressor MraZ [Candidatus Latescibacterota bacterium]
MATQFLGEYEVPVDDKGRVFLPAELRRNLEPEADDTLVVVRGLDGCLTAHPQNAWAQIAERMLQLSQTEQKVRLYIRGTLSQATSVKLDRQGRATISRKLLQRAGITDRMVVIGSLDRLEFWNPEAWQACLAQAEDALEEVAETLDL